jgi:hypothetical protein
VQDWNKCIQILPNSFAYMIWILIHWMIPKIVIEKSLLLNTSSQVLCSTFPNLLNSLDSTRMMEETYWKCNKTLASCIMDNDSNVIHENNEITKNHKLLHMKIYVSIFTIGQRRIINKKNLLLSKCTHMFGHDVYHGLA